MLQSIDNDASRSRENYLTYGSCLCIICIVTTKTVNLRNLPEDLVRRAKAVAAWKGISLKEFVIQAIQQSLVNYRAANATLFVARGRRKKPKVRRAARRN